MTDDDVQNEIDALFRELDPKDVEKRRAHTAYLWKTLSDLGISPTPEHIAATKRYEDGEIDIVQFNRILIEDSAIHKLGEQLNERDA